MRVLALDTATEACSVALLTDAGVSGVFEEVGRGHAEAVLGMVDATLARSRIALDALDGIAASVGPGAFTGVRISVSVAQGLAFGANLPVVPVTTLEALAWAALRLAQGASADLPAVDGHPAPPAVEAAAAGVVVGAGSALGEALHRGQVLVCLDARMGEVYWGCFRADPDRGVVAQGPMAVGPAASVVVPFTGAFLGIGRGFAAYPILSELPGLVLPAGAREALPDARDMARLGARKLAAGEGRDPAELVPVYLRDKVALTEAERAQAKRAPA